MLSLARRQWAIVVVICLAALLGLYLLPGAVSKWVMQGLEA